MIPKCRNRGQTNPLGCETLIRLPRLLLLVPPEQNTEHRDRNTIGLIGEHRFKISKTLQHFARYHATFLKQRLEGHSNRTGIVCREDVQ